MTHAPRVRAFPKPVWIAIVVALPIIGPLLWLFVGKGSKGPPKKRGVGKAPDDDPSFLGSLDTETADERIRRLEEELRKLDEEDKGEPGDSDDNPPAQP